MKRFKDFINEQSLRTNVDVNFSFLNKSKEEFFEVCNRVLPISKNIYFCFAGF